MNRYAREHFHSATSYYQVMKYKCKPVAWVYALISVIRSTLS
jgi:hypothetical protein